MNKAFCLLLLVLFTPLSFASTYSTPAQSVETIIINRDNLPLYSIFIPARTQRPGNPTIFWLHGACKHSGNVMPSILFFAEQGFNNIACDMRAHGKSGGKKAYLNSIDDIINDIIDVYEFYKPQIKGPLFTVGCSAGALMLIRAFQDYPAMQVTASVSLAPCFGFNEALFPTYKRALLPVANLFFPKTYAEFKVNKKIDYPYELTQSFDPDELHCVSTRATYCVYKNYKKVFKLIDCPTPPIHLIMPEYDYIVSTEKTREFYRNLPCTTEKSLTVFQDMHHSILEEKGKEEVEKTILKLIEPYLLKS